MLLRIIFILEILASLCCIHCIYGKKVKLSIDSATLFLCLLIMMEVINSFNIEGLFSVGLYIPILIYCKRVFRKKWSYTIVNFILYAVILTAVEFMSILIVKIFISYDINIRNVVQNMVVLIICGCILPRCHISRLQAGIHKKNKITLALLGSVTLIIFILVFYGKHNDKINAEFFVLVIPFILVLIWLIAKWNNTQDLIEHIAKENDTKSSMQEKYDNLLTTVRLRQHEYKNHLAAILSSHYTYKTYENLVKAQDEYCKRIVNENKHNDLLLINDNIIVGFLYGKILEMEEDGITVEYTVNTKIENYTIPSYHLIEMLGIILDNAVEAIKDRTDKKIIITITEKDAMYQIAVSNIFRYVSYSEIEEWFKLGVSSKGLVRGLGLYHVKELCVEWNGSICCRNLNIQGDNWIEFSLGIDKAGRT